MDFKEMIYNKRMKIKYRGYPLASGIREMDVFANWIKEWSKLKVSNVVEIGANFAQDAECLRHCFGLKNNDIYVFEAHPDIYNAIKVLHHFHAYNLAVYNTSSILEFNCCKIEKGGNSGISTLKKDLRNTFEQVVKVKSIRMDEWMKKNAIEHIDFLKLDVEGANWEVLDGFGDMLKSVNSIHIEAEHIEDYEGEKLWPEIYHKLIDNDFIMIYFQRYTRQSDSFWIQKKFVKKIRTEI